MGSRGKYSGGAALASSHLKQSTSFLLICFQLEFQDRLSLRQGPTGAVVGEGRFCTSLPRTSCRGGLWAKGMRPRDTLRGQCQGSHGACGQAEQRGRDATEEVEEHGDGGRGWGWGGLGRRQRQARHRAAPALRTWVLLFLPPHQFTTPSLLTPPPPWSGSSQEQKLSETGSYSPPCRSP